MKIKTIGHIGHGKIALTEAINSSTKNIVENIPSDPIFGHVMEEMIITNHVPTGFYNQTLTRRERRKLKRKTKL